MSLVELLPLWVLAERQTCLLLSAPKSSLHVCPGMGLDGSGMSRLAVITFTLALRVSQLKQGLAMLMAVWSDTKHKPLWG